MAGSLSVAKALLFLFSSLHLYPLQKCFKEPDVFFRFCQPGLVFLGVIQPARLIEMMRSDGLIKWKYTISTLFYWFIDLSVSATRLLYQGLFFLDDFMVWG